MTDLITRFAPSPTGFLHKGHIASATFARTQGDQFLLRIEDIDSTRCKTELIDAIYEDLAWLGFSWPTPVRVQSQHMNEYKAALEKLKQEGLLYPCFCTRKEIKEEAKTAGQAPHADIGFVYPGTCKTLSKEEWAAKEKERAPVWRLDTQKALVQTGELTWHDRRKGEVKAEPQLFGDVVLARRDTPTCYHLSVTLDDALQNVSLVTRGEDLFASTHIHRLLQALLDLPVPDYHHHPLLYDQAGQRLAKRDGATSIRELREAGESPEALMNGIAALIAEW